MNFRCFNSLYCLILVFINIKVICSINVPIIDISALVDGKNKQAVEDTANLIGKACEEIGFFIIVGHKVDPLIIKNAWEVTRTFFDQPLEEKVQYIKPQDVYPFGYTELGGEVLSAGKAVENNSIDVTTVNKSSISTTSTPPDLKEMFSLGPKHGAGFPDRIFPHNPIMFEDAWTKYYDTLSELARQILKAFAITMKLNDDLYFEKFIDHHASALRAINYPVVPGNGHLLPNQLRASAHTDYGTITILKSDGPGLQVSKDKSPPIWYDVPYVEEGFIINLGDLMRRWTNDQWLSTLHRVVIPSSEVMASWNNTTTKQQQNNNHMTPSDVLEVSVSPTSATTTTTTTNEIKGTSHNTMRRQSLAFFHNINRDAVVNVILRNPDTDIPKHEPIIAGDFLMQKHLASISAATATSTS